jgi:hypothetical protein
MTAAHRPSPPAGALHGDPAVRSAFSDVALGNVSLTVGGAVPDARRRLADLVGASPRDLVFMQQVHGRQVEVVGTADRGRGLDAHDHGVPSADALVTFDVDVAVVVLVADCVPVLLSDPGRAVAAVHAGRAGVASGVVGAAIDAMAQHHGDRVEAVVGPAIGGCCYEVEPELADAVAADTPAARATTTWGTASLDLPAAVEQQLRSRGVRRVTRAGECTRCSGGRWFSHRREPGTGRQAGVIVRGRHDNRAAAGDGRT